MGPIFSFSRKLSSPQILLELMFKVALKADMRTAITTMSRWPSLALAMRMSSYWPSAHGQPPQHLQHPHPPHPPRLHRQPRTAVFFLWADCVKKSTNCIIHIIHIIHRTIFKYHMDDILLYLNTSVPWYHPYLIRWYFTMTCTMGYHGIPWVRSLLNHERWHEYDADGICRIQAAREGAPCRMNWALVLG